MYTLRQKIWMWAIYTRFLIFGLQAILNVILPDIHGNEVEKTLLQTHLQSKFKWIKLEPSIEERGTQNDDQFFAPPDVTFGDGSSGIENAKIVNLSALMFDSLTGLKDEPNYYMHIANNGYTYESCLAFMPLYPLTIRSIADCIYNLYENHASWVNENVITYSTLLLICAQLVNIVAFTVAADRLYLLSRLILRDEYLAYKSALLFAISPISVLFSTPVAESLLAATSFAAFTLVESSGLGTWSGICFALSTATKVCGIPTGLLFVLYSSMRTVAKETILLVRAKKKASTNSRNQSKASSNSRNPAASKHTQQNDEKINGTGPNSAGHSVMDTTMNISMEALIPGLWNIIIVVAPFAGCQWYAYTSFCRANIPTNDNVAIFNTNLPEEIVTYGKENDLLMPFTSLNNSVPAEWCQAEPPISYHHVVAKYWKIDTPFYSLNKSATEWPYLFIACPVYALLAWQLLRFVNGHFRYCCRLGLIDNTLLGLAKPKQQKSVFEYRTLPRECYLYMVHSVGIAAVGVIFIPIQISVRLLFTISPVMYWIAALVTCPAENRLAPIPDNDLNGSEFKPEKIERVRNLKSIHKTILFQETQSDELGNWTKLLFVSSTVLGTFLHIYNYPYLL